MSDPQSQNFWDAEVSGTNFHDTNWMGHPLVRRYINDSIGGDLGSLWPFEWFERWLRGRRFGRALSIGCGTGALERDLIRRKIVQSIDGLDGSIASLAVAMSEAAREGMRGRIRYFAANFNEPVLPRRTYDIVFVHQAMHHVGKLEKLYRAILRTLRRDGLLYLDEYVGPSRTMWTPERFTRHRALFDKIPREYKWADELPYPIVPHDPSEAIRSAEIEEQLRIGYDVVAYRGYGGNFLAPIFPAVDWALAPEADLVALIDEEKRLLASGAPHYHALILAKPKTFPASALASLRYFAEPKLKRVGREIRRRFS